MDEVEVGVREVPPDVTDVVRELRAARGDCERGGSVPRRGEGASEGREEAPSRAGGTAASPRPPALHRNSVSWGCCMRHNLLCVDSLY